MTDTTQSSGTTANGRREERMADIPEGANVVETSIAYNWMTEQRVMWILVKPGAVIGVAEAEEALRVGPGMTGPEPYAMLIDMGGLKSTRREAREMLIQGSPGGNRGVGVAMVGWLRQRPA